MLSPVIITSNHIELSNFRLNKSGYSITLILMYITILIPVIVSILIFSSGGKPSFGLFISWAIFGFIAYFFYRLATWNKHGKEYFILENDRLIYKPQAKNISYKIHEFNVENLVVSIVQSTDTVTYDGVTQNLAWLRFREGENSIQTNIKTPQSVILGIVQTLEARGIKNDLFLDNIKE